MKTVTTTNNFAERVNHVPQSFIREILKVASDPNITSFAGGLPNPACFPIAALEKCATRVLKEQGMQALQYATTEGYFPLREFISNRYQQRYNIKIDRKSVV